MKIKHLHIENFCGLKNFYADFSDRTLVSGANETGKSTVRNAIFYTLTGKLADGSSADGIRPHDTNGTDIDFLDITVALTVEIDGRDVELKKVERQKWTKHRGSEAPTFEGNVTEYFVNDIPKKQKDYNEYIAGIVDAETLLFGTNAQALLSLDTKKRRAKIMSLVGDSSLESIAAADTKYAEIVPMLADGTIDELIARSRKIIKTRNDELKDIPVRIDEVSKQKVDIDVAELELHRNGLKEQIAKLDHEIATGSNKAAVDDLEQKKLELQFNLNDCRRAASEELLNQRHELNSKTTQLEMEADGARNVIADMEHQVALWEKTIADNDAEIARMKPEYEAAKNREFNEDEWQFDETSTVCSLCGQKLPEERIEALKADFATKKATAKQSFEAEKNATIEKIKTTGNLLAVENRDLKEKVEKRKAEIEGKRSVLAELEKHLATLKSEAALLPLEPDMSGNEWFAKLTEEGERLDTEISKLKNAAVDTQALEDRKAEIEVELQGVESQIARANTNAEIDERISELTAQQRTLAQSIADEERRRDLLEALNKQYVETTTAEINKHFRLIKWRMFKPLITNSGYEAVCEPLVDGSSYYKTLNHGAKLLAEIEIMQVFQDLGGAKLFLTVDDAESIDSWRIPEVNRQLVVFKRTDDKELTVKDI